MIWGKGFHLQQLLLCQLVAVVVPVRAGLCLQSVDGLRVHVVYSLWICAMLLERTGYSQRSAAVGSWPDLYSCKDDFSDTNLAVDRI